MTYMCMVDLGEMVRTGYDKSFISVTEVHSDQFCTRLPLITTTSTCII